MCSCLCCGRSCLFSLILFVFVFVCVVVIFACVVEAVSAIPAEV